MGCDIAADTRTCLCTAGLAVVGVAPAGPALGWAVGVCIHAGDIIVSVLTKKTRIGRRTRGRSSVLIMGTSCVEGVWVWIGIGEGSI